MKVKGYLIIEPVHPWRGASRIDGGKITGVRQSKPESLSRGQRALQVEIDIPESFFQPPRIALLASAIEEPDTPESIVAKMQGLVLVREAMAEHFGDDPVSDGD